MATLFTMCLIVLYFGLVLVGIYWPVIANVRKIFDPNAMEPFPFAEQVQQMVVITAHQWSELVEAITPALQKMASGLSALVDHMATEKGAN